MANPDIQFSERLAQSMRDLKHNQLTFKPFIEPVKGGKPWCRAEFDAADILRRRQSLDDSELDDFYKAWRDEWLRQSSKEALQHLNRMLGDGVKDETENIPAGGVVLKPGDFLNVIWDIGESVENVRAAVVPALPPGATRHKALPARCLRLPSGAAFMLGRNDLT